MSVKAATEEQLGELHTKVAKVIVGALANLDKAQEAYSKLDFNEVDYLPPPEVSAPLLGVATKFLSDNKITCQPAESAELSELEEKLKANREKRTKRLAVGNVVHMHKDE